MSKHVTAREITMREIIEITHKMSELNHTIENSVDLYNGTVDLPTAVEALKHLDNYEDMLRNHLVSLMA